MNRPAQAIHQLFERTENETMKLLLTPISTVKLCGVCLLLGFLVSFLL